jgi:hypothetical protein
MKAAHAKHPPAGDEHACAHVVLDEPPDGLAVSGHDELPVSVHDVVALCTAQVVLQENKTNAVGKMYCLSACTML